MIKDHVKARIEAVKAGHMPKISLEEYETLRMNTEEWRAIAPILADDALKHAVENTLKNCSNNYGTYEDALQNVYVPLLMERVFGPAVKSQSIEAPVSTEVPERTYNTLEMWDICAENPEACFYATSEIKNYKLRGGKDPRTGNFCITTDSGIFMTARNYYNAHRITRLPDEKTTYTCEEMWDICALNPQARFLAVERSDQTKRYVLKAGQKYPNKSFCIHNCTTGNVFLGTRADYSVYIITRLPDAT